MTNNWVDIKNANLILVMGGNAAEAHPVGFRWAIEAQKNNNAEIIVVDPRFTRTAAVADHYAPIRSGADIAFLLGAIRYLIASSQVNHEYVKAYTNASFIVRDDYAFHDGLFSGYDAEKRQYDRSSWFYQLDDQGYALKDESLQHPRCVWNLLKDHVARYTPDVVSNITGTPVDMFDHICKALGSTAADNRVATILYATGWTQHSKGAENIRCMAMIQLLLGNMGMAGGGVNALRGHSNIQGITDLGLLAQSLPGYLKLPSDKDVDLATHLKHHTPAALEADQTNYWQHYPAFFVSLLKSFYGKSATAENNFGYDMMPKWDQSYDILRVFEMMNKGKMNGYICQGFNPVASMSNKQKTLDSLSKLKYLVVVDPLVTETSTFWQNKPNVNEVDTASIDTEVFRLPCACFAEEDGTIVSSARWLQWHWKAADMPGEAKGDAEILAGIFLKMRDMYQQEGGTYPDPILSLDWNYAIPAAPNTKELCKELNGKDANGKQLSSFSKLKADGSTNSACWLYTGSWTEAGNQTARRDNSDPSGLGLAPNWAWSWPANRRVLYNRASTRPDGTPWDKSRVLVEWNGDKWVGPDVPDFNAKLPPAKNASPFIMQPEGVGRLFALDKMAEGPFPEHYEPFETPIGTNPLHKNVISNPAARLFKDDAAQLGTKEDYPFVGTTYRLTEHFHTWTSHSHFNAVLQPEQFVEIGVGLAEEKGIKNADMIRVTSKRGSIIAKAYVSKRITPLHVNGQAVHTVGIPIHWGYEGDTKPGYLANTLSPSVGDANSQTPEYKAFLVNVEKVK
ncbi:formate dehydrogenase-N subunit alpha [Photobacterium carnosum]|uniref:Formate dehydrogenase-N subunit alpha n=2 Tax=Photobacterium carnosum TaxID=2023717 RepID=A0A2N4UM81_9GAMM|nr:formate dehydrogenase-N subunit alpha [Photobacterium carnosum]PLC56151.1 formate dehydrogenase-N subunit alpha [Photobacterium carnosum]